MKQKLDTLQLFRGLAALSVALHHATTSTNAFSSQKVPEHLDSLLTHGYLGVDFFFVLSGFIILNSHFTDACGLASAKNYLVKRLVRIYPPYWPISILMVSFYWLLPNVSAGSRGELSLLSTFLLLPSADPPALAVAWTLIHEMIFYCCFLVFFISKALFAVFVPVWASAILAFQCVDVGQSAIPFFKILLHPLNLEFVLGMTAASVWRTFKPNGWMGYIIVACGFLLLIGLARDANIDRPFLGIAFALIVLGGAYLDFRKRISIPKYLVLMGDASYSIYLVHNPVISIASRLARLLGSSSAWYLTLGFGVFTSLVVGILYHKIIEKPLMALCKGKLAGSRMSQPVQ